MLNIEEIEILESMGCRLVDGENIFYGTCFIGDCYEDFDDIMCRIKAIDSSSESYLRNMLGNMEY